MGRNSVQATVNCLAPDFWFVYLFFYRLAHSSLHGVHGWTVQRHVVQDFVLTRGPVLMAKLEILGAKVKRRKPHFVKCRYVV